MSGLEPDELTRLLTEAVEPLRPSPDAYRQIRAGIERRRRWRLPAFAAAGLAMAAVIGLAVVAIRPHPSNTNQLVEPAAPPIVSSAVTGPVRSATVPSTGGTGDSGGVGGSGGGVVTHAPTTLPTTAPPASSSPSVPPASPSAAGPTGPNQNSPTLPTPVAKPAGAGDIDGDGRPDTVRMAGTKVEVQLTRGGPADDLDLGDVVTPLHTAIVDIDADGFSELLVQTTSTNGMDSYAMVRYVSLGVLVPLVPPDGLTLAAGTSGKTGMGFRCTDKTLQVISGSSADGSLFNVVTTTWSLTPDGLLQQGGQATDSIRLPTDPSPFVASCGSLS